MKLCAYLINSTPINNMVSVKNSDLSGNDAYLIVANAAPVPPGYQDISSIGNWDAHWEDALFQGRTPDYKFIRREIAILAASIGWSSLTIAEKTIASLWFAVAKTNRDQIHTVNEQIKFGLFFHHRSVETRDYRMYHCKMEIYNRLVKADVAVVMTDLYKDNLLSLYVKNGREGTLEGDPVGLFDYIEARSGTIYASSGFANKAFTPLDGVTMSALTTHVMEVLKSGIYNEL